MPVRVPEIHRAAGQSHDRRVWEPHDRDRGDHLDRAVLHSDSDGRRARARRNADKPKRRIINNEPCFRLQGGAVSRRETRPAGRGRPATAKKRRETK